MCIFVFSVFHNCLILKFGQFSIDPLLILPLYPSDFLLQAFIESDLSDN